MQMLVKSVLLGASLLAFTGGAHAAAPTKTLPEELRGNWFEDDNHIIPVCSNEDSGLLQVEATEFTFPMEVGTVIDVTEVEMNRYRVRFWEQSASDGAKPPSPVERSQFWSLSHDAEHLYISGNGMSLDLFRCRPQPTE
ncbi:MAG TPA: hypothetical protein VN152_15545 [Sphingopyxis sp.]|nr:hypothetical protein [Sphingopyxis sp.]